MKGGLLYSDDDGFRLKIRDPCIHSHEPHYEPSCMMMATLLVVLIIKTDREVARRLWIR